jgi:RNA polymerase sigma-70 factor (ECF subfamily)
VNPDALGAIEQQRTDEPALTASDAEDLLVRARAGDERAFIEFYRSTSPALLRWFTRRTAAADLAADLCAETYAKALESMDGYDSTRGTGPNAWLYGIAKNEMRTWARRRAVESRARRRLGVDVALPGTDELDLVELRVDLEQLVGPLREALDRLGAKGRDAVMLRVVGQLPYSEVASRLGCSEVAARVRVSRALTRLWTEIDEAGRP